MMKPLLILIGGPTCSGKTSIAAAVKLALPSHHCSVISLDSYYRDLSHLPPKTRAKMNFDHPDAIDWVLLQEQLSSLLKGQTVSTPVYDFTRHVRAAARQDIRPATVCIVEGILALYNNALNALAALRVYVDLPDDICLQRRLARDVAERGRTEASVRSQFDTTVRPMTEQFVRKTMQKADVVLDGRESIERLAQAVLTHIPRGAR